MPMQSKHVYQVTWYPIVPFDCEKQYTYVYATSSRDAMGLSCFNKVQVVSAERLRADEETMARENHWCVNEEK